MTVIRHRRRIPERSVDKAQKFPMRITVMPKILVVGGAGYVGGGITDRLIAAGHSVRVYDGLVYEDVFLKPIEFTYGDVRDRASLQPHLDWADTVVWLAALVGDGACSHDATLTRDINVESVRWLAENFGGRIVFMSTCSVYGAMDGILTEESPTNPLSLYAVTKLEAEEILLKAPNAIMFRLGTLFGLGDSYSRIRMDLVVNTLTVKAFLYGRVSVFGGNQFRPLLHVKDVAEAVVATVDTKDTGIYNLHAVNMTIVEVAELIQKYVPDLKVQKTELQFQDARNYSVSSEKAKRVFGFAPRFTPDDGIVEIKNLVEQGRIRDISSPRFSNMDFLRPMLITDKTVLGFEVASPSKIKRRKAW
jgi:nucleoside-diphosphate-sugar epimerase